MSSEGALDLALHPLALLALADHHAREAAQRPAGAAAAAAGDDDAGGRALGLLFGTQNGRQVRVQETLEMTFTRADDGAIRIQTQALDTDMKLFSEAYPQYECLGWYASGSQITQHHYALHAQLKKYNERPLFVLLDPSAAVSGMRELPVSVYEESLHTVGERTTIELVKAPYSVQSDEAERITVTYCAKVVKQEESGSAAVAHYTTMLKSVQSLHSRISLLQQYLLDVQRGSIRLESASEQALLREIKSLCLRLPVMKSDEFRRALLSEYSDALLVTLLASLTKSTHLLADVHDKFHTATREDEASERRATRAALDEDLGERRTRRGGAHPSAEGGGFFGNMLGSFGVHM